MRTDNSALVGARGSKRFEFLGFHFDALSLEGATQQLRTASAADAFRYVVTPNVDHVVRLSAQSPAEASALKKIYDEAALCLCDSRILAALAKARGINLPVAPGSDLTAKLFEDVLQAGDAINVIGSSSDVAEQLRARYPGIAVAQHIPPMGLRHNRDALRAAADFVTANPARFTFLAVGSPQQEMLADKIHKSGRARGVGLCIGASIEMMMGIQPRAPKVLRRAGLEWAHRLALQPRRMWKRYLIEGPKIFLLAAKWRPRDGA